MADIRQLERPLRGTLRHGEPMSKHVSWRAGGRARTFYHPADVPDLCTFLGTLPRDEPLLFVGLGSNLLVRDGGFAGTVVFTHHALTGIDIADGGLSPGHEPGVRPRVVAGAGVPLPHVARFVAKHGGAGGEWMAGVPGTVGGALAMNAGCYGGETWDIVERAVTIDRDGEVRERDKKEYQIGYRHCGLAREEWFIGAYFRLRPGDGLASRARIKELLARRMATQPLTLPNAGSVFRNPPGDHAARLIESCGLKGLSRGGARVSAVQAR